MKRTFYRPELDALRFFAFLLVFIFHVCASLMGEMANAGGFQAEFADFSKAGTYGVDLFFLLSAYLITELFSREIGKTGTVDVMAFYGRRIFRIWPLYFGFVALTFVGSLFTPVQFPREALVPMLFFYGNFYLMSHPFFSPAGILWSVSVEEQFYLLSPLGARHLSRRRLIAMGCLLIAVGFATRFFVLSQGFDADYIRFNTLGILDPIALGMLASLVLRGRSPASGTFGRAVLFAVGLSCFYIAANTFHGTEKDVSFIDGMVSFPLASLGALAIFLSCLGVNITWKPLLYLGQISYGLYVFHLLGLNVAKEGLVHLTGSSPFWERALIGMAITVPLAAASYELFEKRFLGMKRLLGKRSQPALAPIPQPTDGP